MQKLRWACVAVSLVVCLCCSNRAPAAELYVAPADKDSNPGSFEKPLATLEAARDAIRRIKAAGPLRERGGVLGARTAEVL
jgi:hypothetical protein